MKVMAFFSSLQERPKGRPCSCQAVFRFDNEDGKGIALAVKVAPGRTRATILSRGITWPMPSSSYATTPGPFSGASGEWAAFFGRIV
jgi:hypothetical protein